MIASPQPNPRDGSWGISEEWGRFRQLEIVQQPSATEKRWSESQTIFHKKEPEDFLMENTPTFFHKKEGEDFLRSNTPTIFHKKGRGKNKIPPSGSLVPVVQKKRDKQGRIVEYPRVEGERVHRDLAFDYPHQFVWLYCWAIEDNDGCWQKKSKSVPRHRIWSVRSAIAAKKPVSEILQLIEQP